LELFGQQTRGEASAHVEEVDGFCTHLDQVASDGECRVSGSRRILISVSRKAALTAENQTNELASMSGIVSSTMAELKTRSATTAENTATLSSNVFASVSPMLGYIRAMADVQYATCSERFDQTYAESSKSVKSVLASTSSFLQSGIMEDVPTGITPKKKSWNVPVSWERTEPREALLEAFRRKKEAGDDTPVGEVEEPTSLPTVASTDSIPSVASHSSISSLGVSQMPVQMKVRKPSGGYGPGKLDSVPTAMGKEKERIMVPLGEAGENIPVPSARRSRK
jgi:kinesin family protein 11